MTSLPVVDASLHDSSVRKVPMWRPKALHEVLCKQGTAVSVSTAGRALVHSHDEHARVMSAKLFPYLQLQKNRDPNTDIILCVREGAEHIEIRFHATPGFAQASTSSSSSSSSSSTSTASTKASAWMPCTT